MQPTGLASEIAPQSLACRDVIPSARQATSRELGWHSLLIEVHTGVSPVRPESYLSIATPDQVIGVATSGRYASEVHYGGRWRRGVYQPGSICLLPRNESRHYRFTPRDYGAASTTLVYLPEALMQRTAEHYQRLGQHWCEPHFQLSVDRDPAILQMTQSLLLAMERGLDDLYAESAATWFAVHLVTHHGGYVAADDRRRGEPLVDARLHRVIEFMAQRFAEPLTLDQLAAEACVSKYHFVRLFREKVGQTPHSYLTDIRLDCACQMLLATDLPMAEVASACGFARPSHFSAAFAQRHGVSPSTYRRRRGRIPTLQA